MLWAADVVVVSIKLRLEADYQVTLCSGQSVLSTRSNVIDAQDTIDGLSFQEGIRVGNCLEYTCVRAIIAAHEGRVEVVSQMDEGTRFLIRLPRARPASGQSLYLDL